MRIKPEESTPITTPFHYQRRARLRELLKIVAIPWLCFLMAAAARGQSALDDFDPNANGPVHVVVVQPDGKILLGGVFTTLSPNGGAAVTRNCIARLNPDGTVDGAFDPNANSNQSAAVYAIAVQADGKVLVGGQFTSVGGQPRNAIARLDATTGLADSFDPNASNGPYSCYVDSIVVQADGKILIGGMFTRLSPNGGEMVTRQSIARLHTDGTLDGAFDPNATDNVYALTLQSDGKILVGGHFNYIGGESRHHIARLKASTATPTPIGQHSDPNLRRLHRHADTLRPSWPAGRPGEWRLSHLKAAFDALNLETTQAGSDDYCLHYLRYRRRLGTAQLNQPSVSSWTSLTIIPAGIGPRTVTGATTAVNALINFNGADNVTMDGDPASTGISNLTISNTTVAATAGTSTIRFINGASSNMVRNCTILGSSTGIVTAATGNIVFSTTTLRATTTTRFPAKDRTGGSNLPSKGSWVLPGTSATSSITTISSTSSCRRPAWRGSAFRPTTTTGRFRTTGSTRPPPGHLRQGLCAIRASWSMPDGELQR